MSYWEILSHPRWAVRPPLCNFDISWSQTEDARMQSWLALKRKPSRIEYSPLGLCWMHCFQISSKKGSVKYNFFKSVKHVSSVCKSVRRCDLWLRALATLLTFLDVCLLTKENHCKNKAQRICIQLTFFCILRCCRSWWSLSRMNF